ncbi:hypothetical protein [Actinophytocola sp. KF-1]
MLIFIGMQAIRGPLASGKLVAWGRRPWRLARVLTAISPPWMSTRDSVSGEPSEAKPPRG